MLVEDTCEAAVAPAEKAIPWISSDAKKLMTQDMMDGIIPVKEPIKDPQKLYNQLYADRPEFADYPYNKNVPGRIKRLQATVDKIGDAAKKDLAAFKRDRAINPVSAVGYNGRVLWKNSTAARMLLVDMAANKHKEMTPTQLCASRPCYKPFGVVRLGQRIDQLTEKKKAYGSTPGQMRSKKSKRLPHGDKEKSRKGVLDPYDNAA